MLFKSFSILESLIKFGETKMKTNQFYQKAREYVKNNKEGLIALAASAVIFFGGCYLSEKLNKSDVQKPKYELLESLFEGDNPMIPL